MQFKVTNLFNGLLITTMTSQIFYIIISIAFHYIRIKYFKTQYWASPFCIAASRPLYSRVQIPVMGAPVFRTN